MEQTLLPIRWTADITWTVSVVDNSGDSNTVADLHDSSNGFHRQSAPEVTIYLASEVSNVHEHTQLEAIILCMPTKTWIAFVMLTSVTLVMPIV